MSAPSIRVPAHVFTIGDRVRVKVAIPGSGVPVGAVGTVRFYIFLGPLVINPEVPTLHVPMLHVRLDVSRCVGGRPDYRALDPSVLELLEPPAIAGP